MGKYKVAIQFDRNFLKELQKKENSGVEMCTNTHHIALHPIQLNNLKNSIKDVLNEDVARYHKKLEGILLGYQNIKLLTDKGTIHNDSCYIHFDLQAEFYIFKPEIGKQMQGIVNRISKDHVGLLVYNAFNVAIPKPKNEENWLGDLVDMSYEVLFRITFFSFSSYMPYIRGEIISILNETENYTENIQTNEVKVNKKLIFDDADDIESTKKSKKKKKKLIENENGLEKIDETEKVTKPKKSKKRKDKDTNKETEQDISIGDLHLEELFNTSKVDMIKKEVEEDGNVVEDENLVTKKIKKRKRTATESEELNEIPSPKKKRKRANSDDR